MFVTKRLGHLMMAICALFLSVGTLCAQNLDVTGTVTDKNGEPVVGAYVMIKGTQTGTSTNADGYYAIKVPSSGTLVFSCIGYATAEVSVNGRAKINISLKDDTQMLQDVVVVGYGTQRRQDLTGAVATVDVSKTLEARPQANLGRALQGTVPGLTVINSSGQLNSNPSIVIRGIGSLSSGSTPPLYVVDGVPMSNLSYLNTQDIESISVLKDAASTSIYGGRAAFGVVLITTKAAKATDHVTVTYTNNFGWNTASVLPNYPTVPQQLDALIDANTRAGAANELFGMTFDRGGDMYNAATAWQTKHGSKAGYREMVLGDDYSVDKDGKGQFVADWDVVNIMFRKWTPEQSHNFSVAGSSGKTSYYMSAGYDHEEGLMRYGTDKLNKYNFSLSVNSQVNKWLQIGARANFSQKDYDSPNVRRTTYQYMWRWGSFFGPYGTINGTDCRNDIAYRKQAGDDIQKDAYMRIGGFAKATLFKGFTLNADYTYNLRNYQETAAGLPVYCWDTWGGDITGSPSYNASPLSKSYFYEDDIRDNSYALNVYANYELKICDLHNINVMLGSNVEEGEYRYDYQERDVLLDPELPEFSLATGDQYAQGNHSHWGVAGFFGRLNYNYADKLLVELNGRYDGSSKFGKGYQWGFFPSASAGYRISQEKFWDPMRDVVNNLKLRASYGSIGNQNVSSDLFISTVDAVDADNVDWLGSGSTKISEFGMPGLVSSTLTWENIRTLDLGLDLGLFNNELTANFDWYERNTDGMFAVAKTMPSVLGTSSPTVNAGSLRTRGWELTLEWHHSFDKLNVYAIGNVGDYKTLVTNWDNDARLLNQTYTGKTVGDIWGFETERYFESSDFNSDGSYASGTANQSALNSGSFKYGVGDIKFKDQNGDGVINWGKGTPEDHGDLVKIGNTQPRYQYSFRLGGDFMGFDLDLFFQGVGKRDVWTRSAFVMPMMRGVDAVYSNQMSYITYADAKSGVVDQSADFPVMFGGGAGQGKVPSTIIDGGRYNFYPQTKYITHMAYLRLKNITFGYTIPQNLTQKISVNKIRVYFSANNVCELINKSNAPLDPETNAYEGSIANGTWGRIDPMYRTLSFGAQVTF
jgi:TonB-linked SusC/RagA family outer membrane protein